MDWTRLRDQFPVTRRWAFFDHAAVAPLSLPASQAMLEYVNDLTENGDVHASRWAERIEAVRIWAARLLNANPREIAFIKNTSEGIGFVAEGFPWRAGDNVILAAEEYPANVYPWMNLADRYQVEVRTVPTRDRRIWVEDIRALIDQRTRLISLSFVEFASGFRNDLDSIGQLCRERNIFFFVDAIQGLGVLPLDVRQTPVDALSADGHKWLLGPEGAGIFYIRHDLIGWLRPVGVGWNSVVDPTDFAHIHFNLKPHADRWESGSLNVAGIAALGASLELLLGIGIEAIRDRVLALTDYLCDKAAHVGLEIYSSRRVGDKSGIVSINPPRGEPAEQMHWLRQVVKQCRQQGMVVNKRAGRLRVSPHCYNTHEELDRLIEVVS
jgi:selenocysteine lyase/cysteine desulfurase